MAIARSKGRRKAASLLRRGVLAAGLALATLGSPAQAQDWPWWETLPGFGPPREGPPRERHRASGEDMRRPADPLDDLRPDATPLRSDAMLDALEQAIQRYQELVARGGWAPIPGSRTVRWDDSDNRAGLLRRRLAITGELRSSRRSAYEGWSGFDEDLDPAVRRFQANNGLRVTGRVDKATLDALNVPADARLAQLRANLARLRELVTTKVEDRYILVNAAAFQLEAVERHQVELRHRTVVGKPERATPTVRATIKAVNFFPYWRVPESVATLDLIPRLMKEPDYLREEKIRVLAGTYSGSELDPTAIDWRMVDPTKIRFRQDPGPQNALGLVRLDMPNEHGVYMHDTPMKQLFSQRARAFSAGCVRVQDVSKLAEWVAKHELGWEQPGRAQDVISGGQPLDLNLTRPVPVFFVYITAWAEPDGRIQFRPDIYGRDGVRELMAGAERDGEDAAPPRWTLAP
jgi:L,D-transpeptidase YcbB